ncbi:hypothetical protein BJ085DRAFT_38073 [Dimargaris cristalligena]|uniref:J domain-containing protein n=1 Tax=Dimargaris cristalligena TaxID=215637 RepID=A0A4P9ZKN8_9FUNG|nr:hypothetical protein BJ085DRAFT_38073 [Dimargaris cristalligena]|eukprot:RKP33846.1 hypothetical protein BJ085DRAFT_38073 [Dimargaris cristalligena]
MEHNKDEALRCIEIAKRHLAQGNLPGALKFTKKSIALYPTPTAETLLRRLESAASNGPSAAGESASAGNPTASSDRAYSSARTASASANLRQRGTGSNSEKQPTAGPPEREFTPDQAAAVQKIKACGEDLYAILSVDKGATDVEIKKSYRKLALQFHPDKNGAPGADEAFKSISRAFTILSDADKRAHYDRFGADTDSRMSGGGGGSHGPSFAQSGMYEQEVSPEELFNMFFGGGPAGAGGNAFFASSFGPNVRFQQFGGRPARGAFRRPGQAAAAGRDNSITSTLFALLPLLFVLLPLLTSLLSSVFYTFSSSYSPPEPDFAFQPTRQLPTERITREHAIPYYVNSRDFAAAFDSNPRRLNQFERSIQIHFVKHLQHLCQREIDLKREAIYRAQGWLGLSIDEEKLRKAQEMPLPSCDRLNEMRRSG